LSGSLPSSLISPVASYLGLASSECGISDLDMVLNNQFMSDNVKLTVAFRLQDHVAEAVKCTIGYIRSGKGAIHIICSTVAEAERCFSMLTDAGDINSRLVTSKCSKEISKQAAQEWMSGSVAVLVSTTVALVGNENGACTSVYHVGHPYNVAGAIQAVGRLRPSQRKEYSEFKLFLPRLSESEFKYRQEQSEKMIDVLINAGVIGPNDKAAAEKSFGYQSVVNCIRKPGDCRVQALRNYMGYGPSDPCNNCDRCMRKKEKDRISSLSKNATAKRKEGLSNLSLLQKLYSTLIFKCAVCLQKTCDGTKCLMQRKVCCNCGQPGHHRKSCPVEYKTLLQGKCCYACLQYYGSSFKAHKPGECSMKRRLLSLLLSNYSRDFWHKMSLVAFLEYAFSSEELYAKCLLSKKPAALV